MASGAMDPVVRYLRRVARPRGPVERTDGELLRAFLADRSEVAFEMLVRRHGGMVLGVCRRVLGNLHDAEDAFQATFLVLARKGASVLPREQVGNWLHGVALRTALEARGRRARRRSRELQVIDMPHPSVAPDVDYEALHRLLDQELNRLPAKYRSALVLCELEGRSRKEAALQLGLAEGTLSSRLATGRQMLVKRLARQGVSVPVAGLAIALATQAAQGAVRPTLVSLAARAALLVGAGRAAPGLFSPQVLSLSQGVLKTMFLHRLKVISVLLLGITLGAAGVGTVAGPAKGEAAGSALPVLLARAAIGQQNESAEPLESRLLLDEGIQKELRLSSGQIKRLKDTVAAADRANEGVRQEIDQLKKRIAQLQKQVEDLHAKTAADREQALRQAAPDILSPRAITRLRQIQRQYRGPQEILKDPRVQRLLKVNDEQMMKIEKTLKDTPRTWHALNVVRSDVIWADVSHSLMFGSDSSDSQAVAKAAEVLTPEQRRVLQRWLGEPYRASSNWNWLWPKEARKGQQ
jgi:RNA polymerase sigma factor (sigma-70 family)